ncbi:KDO2-lipid IV(A) lauroyltransferase [Pseudoduganella flava]|uniref:KDO2-lipid IV(A) lauroyltransferase n=1 Tax=Pseudoduganella flava TaxID=871742 RepID=A0A562PMY1_9BURK|nr:lysophospholipid acyltransferase family protein [Pseudoduganella flava]QGZ40706.1 lysophospholipid acyltransferase family protein [Pseudoduganella flava]TWI45779.1 KDO2-lipid IV(A) lauroyltransferase [Pseudoduganella flava]
MLLRIFRFFSIFPLPVLHALGSVLGWLVYLASPSYRRRMRENIARAGFAGHLRQAVAEAGKAIAELPFVWLASDARIARRVFVKDYSLVEQHLAAGCGIVFLTPHLGCFEITAQRVSHDTPLMVMYRPPKQQAIKPLVEGARARGQMLLAPANLSGVRMLAKFLKSGKPIGILPDQVPQEGEGVWADFFGRPAYTMTLPAKMAKLGGDAPIVLTYAERLPRGRGFLIHFVPFTGSLDGDAAQQARAINAAMEQLIAGCPAQYYWSYNRYKIPAGVAAPGASREAA